MNMTFFTNTMLLLHGLTPLLFGHHCKPCEPYLNQDTTQPQNNNNPTPLKQPSTIPHTPKYSSTMNTILHIARPKPVIQIPNKKTLLIIILKHHTQHNLLILQCGDIHPNLGPMPNLLQTHPTAHKRRQNTYFLPSTIKFQHEYLHLAKTFGPLFLNTHQLHEHTTLSLPYLYNYIQQHINHPSPQIIYAIIVTISPSTERCNTYLQQTPLQDWTTLLLEKMTTLPNPPERHMDTPHPYTQF